MKVKPLVDKLRKFNFIGMPCTSKEFSDLRKGKSIALPVEIAELMKSMGLVQIVEDKKSTSKEKK